MNGIFQSLFYAFAGSPRRCDAQPYSRGGARRMGLVEGRNGSCRCAGMALQAKSLRKVQTRRSDGKGSTMPEKSIRSTLWRTP